jgi:hypothetical protein
VYQQTGPSTVALDSSFFYVYAITQNAGDFANGTLEICGGGTGCPQTLWSSGNQFFSISPAATLSALDAAFPPGDYTVTLSDPGSASSTVEYSQNLFPAGIPTLTAATYDALQGLNPASGITINFNASSPDLQLILTNTSNGAGVFEAFGLTTTSVFMPANTLLPSSTYEWTLTVAQGTFSYDSNNVLDQQAFDVETSGTFTTEASTPEPGTVALMSLGLALCAFRMKRLGR